MVLLQLLSGAPRRHFGSVAQVALASDAWAATHLSPAVAFLIHSGHFDASSVKGSGRAGRILKADVLKAISAGSIKKAPAGTGKAATQAATIAAGAGPTAMSTGQSSVGRRSREYTD